MKAPPTNVTHSIRERLKTAAKDNNVDFQSLLVRYAIERFLYRLSNSAHRGTFVLKGATLFRAWSPQLHRPTKDIDLLGSGNPTPERLAAKLRDVCIVAVEDDGIKFEPASIKAERIKENALYEGVRVTLIGNLDAARIPVQIDVGFGDATIPAPTDIALPPILSFMKGPSLIAYSRETFIAEKLHAMVYLGSANSRMKDFFDIRYLSQTFDFNGAQLLAAISATFERRETAFSKDLPFALTDDFVQIPGKQAQWNAFMSRISEAHLLELQQTVVDLRSFLAEPMGAANAQTTFLKTWRPRGPWR